MDFCHLSGIIHSSLFPLATVVSLFCNRMPVNCSQTCQTIRPYCERYVFHVFIDWYLLFLRISQQYFFTRNPLCLPDSHSILCRQKIPDRRLRKIRLCFFNHIGLFDNPIHTGTDSRYFYARQKYPTVE